MNRTQGVASSLAAVAAAFLLAGPSPLHAAIVNGGFETGNISGWTPAGSAHATDASFGISPTVGTYQGYLETTGNFTVVASAVATSLGVSGPTVLGLGAGPPVNGSAMSQDVTVSAGDVLSFDWNFATDELNEEATYNDFAFFTIDSAAFLLASRNSSVYNTTSPPAGFDGQTGWATQTYTFPSAGTYKVGFATLNVGDAGHNSVLLLDNITIPVPEPSSALLLVVGMAGVAGWRRLPKAIRLPR